MNCLLAFALLADVFDAPASRVHPVYVPGMARTENRDRVVSQSHGVNCMCWGCQSVRIQVRRNDEAGRERDSVSFFEENEETGVAALPRVSPPPANPPADIWPTPPKGVSPLRRDGKYGILCPVFPEAEKETEWKPLNSESGRSHSRSTRRRYSGQEE